MFQLSGKVVFHPLRNLILKKETKYNLETSQVIAPYLLQTVFKNLIFELNTINYFSSFNCFLTFYFITKYYVYLVRKLKLLLLLLLVLLLLLLYNAKVWIHFFPVRLCLRRNLNLDHVNFQLYQNN